MTRMRTVHVSGNRAAVAEVKDGDVRAAVRRTIEMLGGMDAFVSPGDSVLIKPNMFINDRPESGRTTHPAVIVEAAKLARRAGASKVTVAERNFAFRDIFAGFEEIYEHAEVINLDEAEHRHTVLHGARNIQHPVPVPKVVDEADVFINCPGIRTHALTRMSNALKNLMGILPASNTLHVHGYGLEESCVDLNRHRPSDLVISDAYIALEGNFPSGGSAKKLNFIVSSDNVVVADVAAALLMGIEPAGVPMIVEAAEEGLGPASPDEICFLGERLVFDGEPVEQAPDDYNQFAGEIDVSAGGECYACRWALAGGLAASRADGKLWEAACGSARIVVGPAAKAVPSPFNVFYGHCANRVRKEMQGRGGGVYVPGCPPLAGFVKRALGEVTRRPKSFIAAGELKARTVDEVLSEASAGEDVTAAAVSPDAVSAINEIKRLVKCCRTKDGARIMVVSRNGLGEESGLRFLMRLAQYAAAVRESAEITSGASFHAALDLDYLAAARSLGESELVRLVRRMAFACGAVVLPDEPSDGLLLALVD
ncbi:MAG TPA: DUF362 domain-containing protein, partial [Planctomycetes bacterium]|nr:DUF362 domain-containing protein [Planctomycetota bacterium]